MKLRLETPAPVAETIELYTRNGIIKRIDLKLAIMTFWKSDTFGFVDDKGLVAVIGLGPMPAENGETIMDLWFVCAPRVREHLREIARIARLTLAKASETTGMRIRASVRKGHLPGRKLARLAKLEPAGEIGGFEIFEWRTR